MRYGRPAVYIERTDAAAPQPVVLRTDIAAFVGIARRGPLDTPVPVGSFRQFAAHFGEFTGAGYLAYAVRGFFENGGQRCWVVRVANLDAAGGARAASIMLNDTAGRPALTYRRQLAWHLGERAFARVGGGIWGGRDKPARDNHVALRHGRLYRRIRAQRARTHRAGRDACRVPRAFGSRWRQTPTLLCTPRARRGSTFAWMCCAHASTRSPSAVKPSKRCARFTMATPSSSSRRWIPAERVGCET